MKKIKFKDESWNFARFDTKNSVHNLHSYPAMLTPSLVNRVFNELDSKVEVVLDPFVGSGTVLVESLKRNFSKVYGFDINPLALLISKVKTTHIPEDLLISSQKNIEKRFLKYKKEKRFFKELLPNNLNIKYWFKSSIVRDLTLLKKAINAQENKDVKDFFNIVLAETALRTSYKRSNEFKMYRMSEEKLNKFKPNVLVEFIKKSDDSIKRLNEFHTILISKEPPKLCIHSQDARNKSAIEKESVDLVITSPPYGDSRTTVAYGEFSKIGGLWLDLPEVTSLDRKSLGGITKKETPSFESPTLNKIIKKIKKLDERRAIEVQTFFNDFYLCFNEIDRVLKPGKLACFIVGNRSVKGQTVQTDKIIVDMFHSKRYYHVKTIVRNIPSKKMPRYISPSGIEGQKNITMQYEYLVFLRKRT